MEIPLVDLHKLHSPILEKIEKAMNSVISRSSYISGVEIEEFEKDFAAFMKVDHVVGTDALFLALRSIDIEEGDCVVTVPNTFIATTEAITMAGGVIAFVDVDEKTANMCPEALENFLKNRTGKEI
jgi:dTDP-4-amino-4,6-dideoxygalactose transaminase